MLIKRSIAVLTAAVSVASTASLFVFSSLMGLDQSAMAESPAVISFECQFKQGRYTTVATKAGKSVDFFIWNSDRFIAAGYSNERRCSLVSERLESYSSAGELKQLTHGIMNGEKVICTALTNKGRCHKLVYTLHPEDNAKDKLQALISFAKGNVSTSIYEAPERFYLDVDKYFYELSSGNSNLSDDQNTLFNDSVFK